MDEPVDHRGGDGLVAEDLAPGGEGLVAGDDQRGAFVAAGRRARTSGWRPGRRRGCSRPRRRSSSGVQSSRRSSSSRRPCRCASPRRATHSVAVAKATRWPARQARIPSAIARCVLPVPGGPEQDDVVFGGEEVELAEVQDERLLDGALEAEVELLERLAGGEAGLLDPASPPCASLDATSVCEQRLGEALVAPLLGPCALGQLRQRPRRRRRLQRPEQVAELGLSCVMPGSARRSGRAAAARPRARPGRRAAPGARGRARAR